MNEDEKKAVEFLKENLLNYEEIDTSILLDINSKHKTLLNLIEKLQKENKYMHSELDKQQTKINKYAKENELAKQELIKNSNIADEKNQLLKENQQLKKQIKDKIDELKIINVDGEMFTTAVNFAILTLQELIKEREKN